MKASIVIPAFNESEYIGKTLEAVLNQDFPDGFEVIVVDNASTDYTAENARRFPGVKVIREDRRGVQWARERGRKEARGEILAYLDADSLPPKDWLKNGIAYFARPDVVGVSGPYDYYDAKPFFRYVALYFQKIIYRGTHFLVHQVFRGSGVMIGGNSFIRASALEKIGGFNTSIKFYGDDTDTARRLRSVGRTLFRGNVTVQSSARRFEKMGMMRVLALYLLNFLWVSIFKKPISQ